MTRTLESVPYIGDPVLVSENFAEAHSLPSREAYLINYCGHVSSYRKEYLNASRWWEVQLYFPDIDKRYDIYVNNFVMDTSRQAEDIIKYKYIGGGGRKYHATASMFSEIYLEKSIKHNKAIEIVAVMDNAHREEERQKAKKTG